MHVTPVCLKRAGGLRETTNQLGVTFLNTHMKNTISLWYVLVFCSTLFVPFFCGSGKKFSDAFRAPKN